MLPRTVALSTSPSPANVPVVIDTVAPASSRLSGSDTDTAFDSTAGPPLSVKCALVATFEKAGGALIAVMAIVLVAVPLVTALPLLSNTVQVTVRAGSEPKSVGLSLGVV